MPQVVGVGRNLLLEWDAPGNSQGKTLNYFVEERSGGGTKGRG